MLKIIRCLYSQTFTIIMCGMLAGGIAYAQAQEYKEYTVKKGDTLWDISSKEITDPFQWPKIWKENPEIKNPDLIYPGQKIKIPQLLIQKEIAPPPPPPPPPVERAIPKQETKPQPQVKKEEPAVKIKPVEKEYLVDRDTLVSSGYISEAIESKGEVIGSPPERTLLGRVDYAYVRTTPPVKAGDKFYIIRSMGKVKHPETGAMMGYLIDVRGIAEVVGKESGETKVKITASYSDVLVGDLLIDYYEIESPLQVENPRKPDMSGFIVATKQRKILNGQPDIVYIDKGRKNGIEIGDILGMTARAQYNIPNGYVQVISTKESIATAIVRKSGKEVTVGDRIGPGVEDKSAAKLVRTKPPGENLENAVNLFINQYTRTYESGDIDRFMSFYSTSAVENDSLHYDDIRRAYQKNFQDNRYTYTLKNLQAQKSDDRVILTGTYSIKKIQGDAMGTVTQGNIRWTLAREEGALKIIKVDYDRT